MTQATQVRRRALGRGIAAGGSSRYRRWGKPLLDFIGAVALLVVFLPLLLLVAAGVRLTLGRPVLLRQRRVGEGGAVFEMLKFRTMHADRRRESRPFDGPDRRRVHKSPHDPRHTPFGRVLRACSLDELPQLWNVLRGDMSLVGPRPELIEIVERYEPWQHARHAVRPGLTGLWQVTDRANGEGLMHEHTATDLRYIAELSFSADLRILLRTVPALLGWNRGS